MNISFPISLTRLRQTENHFIVIGHKVNGPGLKSLKRYIGIVSYFDFLTVNTWLAQKSLREHRNRILGEVFQ